MVDCFSGLVVVVVGVEPLVFEVVVAVCRKVVVVDS